MTSIPALAEQAHRASIELSTYSGQAKNKILTAVAHCLQAEAEQIFAANQLDLAAAEASGVAAAIKGRLKFDAGKLETVLDGIRQLIDLPEPVGQTTLATELAPGLDLYRVTVPLGVIGVIFEARPDALVQIAVLCLKSANSILLKGGSETAETNRVLAGLIAKAAAEAGAPDGWISLLESRSDVADLLACDGDVDLLIPRGSNEFVRYIMDNTKIPVLGHADGVCHTYVDRAADEELALKVCLDAKTQYVSVCNATETILLDRELSKSFVERLLAALREAGVKVYGDANLATRYQLSPLTDYHHEYLDLAVSVCEVDGVKGAVDHVNKYGSGHTDAILTEDAAAAAYFMDRVDAANVFHNCSTRFSDGFRYGFGAEVGVSTGKIHARGPVGLEGLLTYKYKLFGHGDTVGPFSDGERSFTHRPLQADPTF